MQAQSHRFIIACHDTAGVYYWSTTGLLVGRKEEAARFRHAESSAAFEAMQKAQASFATFQFSGRPYWQQVSA